jgi:hypothetical protein
MSVSDADNELLEAHLDGELPGADETALLARLASDHELAADLASLRAERALRADVFDSLEPDDLTVRRLISSVQKQITRDSVRDAVRGDRMRILRYIASAAAVVIFSFSAGWLGKARVAGVSSNITQGPPSLDALAKRDDAGAADENNPIVGTEVMNTLRPHDQAENPAGYQVNLTDPFGHVVAVQHFNTLEEAREFSEDVTRWQRQQQMRNAEPLVYKDQF